MANIKRFKLQCEMAAQLAREQFILSNRKSLQQQFPWKLIQPTHAY